MKVPIYVAIPVYNGGRTIKRTLENLARQTYKNFKILIYNDGSTDWTERIIRKAAEADNRIKVITSARNEGRGAARNHLLQAAQDGVIAWQDADDTWHPSKLSEQIAYFNSISDRGMDRSRSVLISTFDRITMRRGLERATTHVPPEQFNIPYIFSDDYGRCPFQLQATLGLAEVYLRAGGFDPDLNWAEDVDIALKILTSEHQIVAHQARHGLTKYYHSLSGVDGDVVAKSQARLIDRYRPVSEKYGIDIDEVFSNRRLGYLFNIYLENKKYAKAIFTTLSSVIDADEEKLMMVSRNLVAVFRAINRSTEESSDDEV